MRCRVPLGRCLTGHPLAQLTERKTTVVEDHEHVTGDRARPNQMDSLVGGQVVPKLQRQGLAVPEAGDAQTGAIAQREDDVDGGHTVADAAVADTTRVTLRCDYEIMTPAGARGVCPTPPGSNVRWEGT